jgi:chromosome segregation ATPase
MQLTASLELTAPPSPESVAKTDKSITLRLRGTQLDRKLAFQVSHSEYGYVYYSWTESEIFSATMHPIKGLTPNTNYVFRARTVDEATQTCSEWSPLTAYIRTFTEEEDAKRAGTYFEHALKLEREQKTVLQKQISKLTVMLDENSSGKTTKSPAQRHEDMLSSRRVMDTNISKLQAELSQQAVALQAVRKQRAADEQMITELLNEQEALRRAQQQTPPPSAIVATAAADHARVEQEVAQLRSQLEANESALVRHQAQVSASQAQIAAYEASLGATRDAIASKEAEVERLMADCNRVVQEQADLAAVKQLEIEDALLEAKTSLEQQLDINTYLRDEVGRLREENHHLKNQIGEIDSEIAPKMMRLEDENEHLRAQLAAYRGR